ncbi:MAG: hypothetical protein M1817_004130 [Caeruleum heppii]|nr:MAG: hypothetical protein M1817_004130 [Caeruleum heppii]
MLPLLLLLLYLAIVVTAITTYSGDVVVTLHLPCDQIIQISQSARVAYSTSSIFLESFSSGLAVSISTAPNVLFGRLQDGLSFQGTVAAGSQLHALAENNDGSFCGQDAVQTVFQTAETSLVGAAKSDSANLRLTSNIQDDQTSLIFMVEVTFTGAWDSGSEELLGTATEQSSRTNLPIVQLIADASSSTTDTGTASTTSTTSTSGYSSSSSSSSSSDTMVPPLTTDTSTSPTANTPTPPSMSASKTPSSSPNPASSTSTTGRPLTRPGTIAALSIGAVLTSLALSLLILYILRRRKVRRAAAAQPKTFPELAYLYDPGPVCVEEPHEAVLTRDRPRTPPHMAVDMYDARIPLHHTPFPRVADTTPLVGHTRTRSLSPVRNQDGFGDHHHHHQPSGSRWGPEEEERMWRDYAYGGRGVNFF